MWIYFTISAFFVCGFFYMTMSELCNLTTSTIAHRHNKKSICIHFATLMFEMHCGLTENEAQYVFLSSHVIYSYNIM